MRDWEQIFVKHDFTAHSGDVLTWKIECDALSVFDIETLAYLISCNTKFSEVYGVPTGGLKLMVALQQYSTHDPHNHVLIVDDVLTTGTSMEEFKSKLILEQDPIGVVIFARGPCPDWVTPVFDYRWK